MVPPPCPLSVYGGWGRHQIKALLYTVKLFVKRFAVAGCQLRVNSYLELIMHLFGTRCGRKTRQHSGAITLSSSTSARGEKRYREFCL